MVKKILFGFDAKKVEDNIVKQVEMLGYECETNNKFTKSSIKEFLMLHDDYDTVVLREQIERGRWSAEELAELADEREMNIVILLSGEHKGTSYAQTIYTAGILSAIFQMGKHGGATEKELAQLIVNKRTRKEAREYYGLENVDVGILSNDAFVYYYKIFTNPEFGNHPVERFMFVCSKLSPRQVEDFIKKLSKNELEELSQFSEFHNIINSLKASGVEIKVKKPKKLKELSSVPRKAKALEEKKESVPKPKAKKGLFNFGTSQSSSSATGDDLDIDEEDTILPTNDSEKHLESKDAVYEKNTNSLSISSGVLSDSDESAVAGLDIDVEDVEEQETDSSKDEKIIMVGGIGIAGFTVAAVVLMIVVKLFIL